MNDFILQYESQIRLSFSLGGLLLFLIIGLIKPFRQMKLSAQKSRWPVNIILPFISVFIIRFAFPLALVSLALKLKTENTGLFNYLQVNSTLSFILSLFLLDFFIYFQHVLTHKIPLLWRLHRLHHSDIEFDTTTAHRFHPIEIILSYGFKALIVYSFGIPAVAIIVFEVLINFSALFNHSNFSLPKPIENFTRLFIVTPDMHRVHHSVIVKETNSNYGFCLSIWDKIFKTYIKAPSEDPQSMPIGIYEFRDPKSQSFLQLLIQPFINPVKK